jgi:serine protease Do
MDAGHSRNEEMPPAPRSGIRLRAFAAVAILALVVAVLGWNVSRPTAAGAAAGSSGAVARVVLPPPLPEPDRAVPQSVDSYADLVARVAPAVVTVRAERMVRAPQQFPFFNDPFFRDFFGDRMPRQAPEQEERRQQGLGSGVLVRNDGYIVTNHHVIDGAEEIRVEMSDRRVLSAKLVGSDPPSDLAVLKVEGQDFPTLTLGETERVRVGDVVLAIGNPLGIGQTVTQGIISAKGRSTGLGSGSFEDFLQTDAPINRGNSGGALVNTRGELVGINSQILSPSGGNIGIGFAIPANMARDVMEQLINEGSVRRGLLGVTVQPITSELAASLKLPAVSGAIVAAVSPDSAADKAGVRRGDVITEVNGQPVDDSNSLRNQVARLRPGTKAELTVIRDGKERTLAATLDELPVEGATTGERRGERQGDGLGLSVEPLTPQMANRLGVKGDGVVVSRVEPGSPGARAGIRQRDVIEEVNGQTVRSAAEFRKALEASGDRPALVLLTREGQSLYLTIERC